MLHHSLSAFGYIGSRVVALPSPLAPSHSSWCRYWRPRDSLTAGIEHMLRFKEHVLPLRFRVFALSTRVGIQRSFLSTRNLSIKCFIPK